MALSNIVTKTLWYEFVSIKYCSALIKLMFLIIRKASDLLNYGIISSLTRRFVPSGA